MEAEGNPESKFIRRIPLRISEEDQPNDGFVKSSPVLAGQGAQEPRSEVPEQVRRHNEPAAQSRFDREEKDFLRNHPLL